MAYPLAVLQISVEPGEPGVNRLTVIEAIGEAVARGAKLVLLPEACITDIYRGAEMLAEPIPGISSAMAATIAGDAVIALPLLEKAEDGKVHSSCALITHEGIHGVARKTHLYRDASGHDLFHDDDVVSPGRRLSIFEIDGVNIGVLLGFDADFPECFRTLALRGADVILVAQNCVEPDAGFLSAMASHNRIPIAVSNRLGFRKIYPGMPESSALSVPILQDKDGTFIVRCKGGSAIFDADGRAIAQPTYQGPGDDARKAAEDAPAAAVVPSDHFQEEEVLTASLRIEELRVQRLTSPYFAQRRADLYQM